MRLNNQTCRLCLTEQNPNHGQKLEDISVNNHSDAVVQALKNVFGWEVRKSEPLTKICMECKGTLLQLFIFVKEVKKNDQKWRKIWLKSVENEVLELSSEDETSPVPIKSEKDIEVDDNEDSDRPVYNPNQYIKEEGETSDSEFEEKELIIECDVGTMVSSTTMEDRPVNMKTEPSESPKKRTRTRVTTAMRDLSTTDESMDDSDIEEIPQKKPTIDLTEGPPKKLPVMTHSILSSTTSTLACNQEITKNGFDSLAEKMLAIKRTPNLTDDQKCKIFYGLKCYSCSGKDFDTLNELESHFSEVHGINKISVKCCGLNIIKPIMVDHIKYHLGMQKSSLKDHIRRLETMQICEECGLLYASEKQLKYHIANAHTALHTTLRTRSFSLGAGAAHSINITSGEIQESRYACDVCEKPFYYESSMKRHKVKHLSAEEQLKYKRYECHDCGMKFFEKSDIQKHIEKIHAKYRRMSSGRVTCLECNHVLSSVSKLMIHKAIHWTEEERKRNLKHKCHVCNKLFWLRCSLMMHQKQHTKDPKTAPFQCPSCEKRFTKSDKLSRHLRIHMTPQELYANKTHECSTCNRRYWTERALSDHIKFYHLKVHDYVCKKCKHAYASMHSLKYHTCGKSRARKPEEKHECEFCGKIFNAQITLKTHMYQWHLPGYIFECPTCKRGFNHSNAFYQHKQKCEKKGLIVNNN